MATSALTSVQQHTLPVRPRTARRRPRLPATSSTSAKAGNGDDISAPSDSSNLIPSSTSASSYYATAAADYLNHTLHSDPLLSILSKEQEKQTVGKRQFLANPKQAHKRKNNEPNQPNPLPISLYLHRHASRGIGGRYEKDERTHDRGCDKLRYRRRRRRAFAHGGSHESSAGSILAAPISLPPKPSKRLR